MLRLLGLAALLAGCGSTPLPSRCDDKLADGTCIGVTRPLLCGATFCTEGASCARTFFVREGGVGDGSADRPLGSLQQAAATAADGDCVALAAGSYQGATFAGGVRLLGAGADASRISGTLRFAGGTAGGLLRGVRLSGEGRALQLQQVQGFQLSQLAVESAREVGIEARQAVDLTAEQLSVKSTRPGGDGAFGVGVLIADGSRARLSAVAVDGSAAEGLLCSESSLELGSSAISRSGSYGMAIDCTGAPCGELGWRVTASRILESSGVGLWVRAPTLTVQGSEIGTVKLRASLARAVELQGVARLELASSSVHDSEGLGLLLDNTRGRIAQSRVETNGDRGVWVQNLVGSGLALSLEDNQLIGNGLAGLGLVAASGVTVQGGRVAQTRAVPVILGGGAASIGDGIQVLAGSSATMGGLHVESNDRVAVLIDAAQASLVDSVLTGKDLLVLQNVSGEPGTFSGVTGADGKAVTAQRPATAFAVDPRPIGLVSWDPIPLP